jgi:hypothetical protein
MRPLRDALDFPAQFTDVNSGTLPTAINDKGRWFQPDSAVFADGSTTGSLALPTMYLRLRILGFADLRNSLRKPFIARCKQIVGLSIPSVQFPEPCSIFLPRRPTKNSRIRQIDCSSKGSEPVAFAIHRPFR